MVNDNFEIEEVEAIISDGKTLALKSGANVIELQGGIIIHTQLNISRERLNVTSSGDLKRFLPGRTEITLNLEMKFLEAKFIKNSVYNLKASETMNETVMKVFNAFGVFNREVEF